jgi:hypothetical protein
MQAHYQFTQSTYFKRHYATFPKAISQMAASVQFATLELSLTQGRWVSISFGKETFIYWNPWMLLKQC